MTYAELQAQVTALLNRRDLTTALNKTFIQQALARIQRTLRIPSMEKSVTVTASADLTTTISIPVDFLEVIDLINVTKNYRMRPTDLTTVIKEGEASGDPIHYARQGGSWYIGPAAGAGQQFRLNYYGQFDALTNDSDTNNLSIIAPDMLVYGALSYACDYFLDKRAGMFEQRFLQILADVQGQMHQDALAGGAAIRPMYPYDVDGYY